MEWTPAPETTLGKFSISASSLSLLFFLFTSFPCVPKFSSPPTRCFTWLFPKPWFSVAEIREFLLRPKVSPHSTTQLDRVGTSSMFAPKRKSLLLALCFASVILICDLLLVFPLQPLKHQSGLLYRSTGQAKNLAIFRNELHVQLWASSFRYLQGLFKEQFIFKEDQMCNTISLTCSLFRLGMVGWV